jgi:hypothetical protein
MIGRETVQRVLSPGFFRGPGQRLLGALLLCFPVFFLFFTFFCPSLFVALAGGKQGHSL